MYRLFLIIAFALVVGSGAIVAAQGATGQTDAPEAGAQADCGTPVASPGASPEIVEVAIDEVTPIVSLDASPGASPVALDLCATPEGDVPAA